MRRLEVEFSRVGLFHFTNVARVLDTSGLHPQTDAEEWRTRLARVTDRANHSRHAAFAESTGHKDGVEVAQTIFVVVVHQLFRLDPLHIDTEIVCYSTVRQRFTQRLV